jgi:glycosyltransferase involved in cell wall biosynthesis
LEPQASQGDFKPEKRKMTVLRIGIPIIGNKDWLGGVHYVKSLVEAAASLPQNERPRIFLVVNDHTLPCSDLHRDFFALLDGFIFLGRNILQAKAILPSPVTHCRSEEEFSNAMDFFYPVVGDVMPNVCSGSWIYDFQHVYLPEFFSRDEINSRNAKFRRIAETAKLAVLSSKSAEQDFRRIFPESKAVTRVLSFHSLPSEHWYTSEPSDTQRKHTLPGKFLICCNQFWIHKNHRLLFEAMADVVHAAPDTHLVCTGSTGDWRFPNYFHELIDFVKNRGLQNRIRILGAIPRMDQIQLMRRSLAVIQPSLFEGWSSVVEETRMLGKTVILSDLAVHHEQAPDHAIYFDRHNAKDLSEKILDVLPHLSAGPDHTREQEAKRKSIDLTIKFGRHFCSIAVEAQNLFQKRIGGKATSPPLSGPGCKSNPPGTCPVISIVTPSLNQGKFLEECIDSILSQNYPNLEYIIMDGGSTDNSVDIIKKYAKYLTYWQSRPDNGHYAAVNEGFKKTTGEIMGWLNSDDKFHPDGLSVLGEVFSRFPHVHCLTGKRIGFDASGNMRSFGFEQQTWNRSMLLDKNTLRRQLFIMQEATYWRRGLWEKAGASLDLSYAFAADFELWLRFTRFTQLHTVDALIAGFRYYGKEQRSQIFLKEYMSECAKTIDREKGIASENPRSDGISPPLIGNPLTRQRIEIAVRKEQSKISIVTPSFNQGQFLEECIDSILSQNYPNLEYLVMDGGSSDNSVEIIKKYEKHLTYWQSRPDNGQYAAINEGFRKTTGEIMTWLNSDDILYPKSLDTVSEILARFGEIEWLMGRPNGIDEHGKRTWVVDPLPLWSREKYLKRQYRNPYIQQEGTFWKRSLWEKAGSVLDTNWKLAGDMELWARFFRYAQLYSVDALLGAYRKHVAQKTATGINEYNREAEQIIDREIQWYEQSSDKTLLPAPPPVNIQKRSPAPKQTEPVMMSGTADKQSPIQVSAIVSAYNAERFIRGCLEDLVRQTLYQKDRLEIVVVDSGSEQNEKAVVEEFMKSYKNIVYIRTAMREGIYAAWNRGIKAARGEYITNANTDDRHRSDALEVMAFMLNRRPDIGLVYADVLITNKENDTYEKIAPVGAYRWEDFRREILACHTYMGPQPMWRKSLHEKYGYFNESFAVSGDWEFWLRIAEDTQFLHIPEFLGLYLASSGSIEHQNMEGRSKEDRRIQKIYIPKYFPKFEEYYASILKTDPLNGNAVYWLGRILTSLEQYDKAIDVYSAYLEKKPDDVQISRKLDEVKFLSISNPSSPVSESPANAACAGGQEGVRASTAVSIYNAEDFLRTCFEEPNNQPLPTKEGFEIVIAANLVPFKDTELIERQEECVKSISHVIPSGVIPLNICYKDEYMQPAGWHVAPVLKRSADVELKINGKRKPFVTDLFDAAWAWAEKRGVRWFALSNSDILFTPRLIHELRTLLKDGYETLAVSRTDLLRIDPVSHEIQVYLEVLGYDVFICRTDWWTNNRRLFQAYIFGEKAWDNAFAAIMGTHSKFHILYSEGLCLHFKHPMEWTQGPYADYNMSIYDGPDSDYQAKYAAFKSAILNMEKSLLTFGTTADLIKKLFRGPGTTPNPGIKVSAIVSTYNSEKFIRGCLEDLVDQTLYEKGMLEIIVVNSGSQQNEETVVKEFQTRYPNIDYIKTEGRETIYAAWNRGIKNAKGRYITNANTDDRHRRDALEVMSRVLDEDPATALVYADQIITKTENETFEKCHAVAYYKWPDFDRKRLLHSQCIGSQPMWRRSLHDEFGYFMEDLNVAGDYEWWLRISDTYSMKRIPELLGLYLLNDSGLEHSNRDLCIKESAIVRKLYMDKAGIKPQAECYPSDCVVLQYDADHAIHTELPQEVMSYINQADAHIANNDLASAREAIQQALRRASGHPHLSPLLATMLANLESPEAAEKFLGTKGKDR